VRQFIPRVAFALLLAAPATAAAQSGVDPTTLSLEDLMATPVERVYGASKFQQKVSDAPAAVTILTADEIRLHGYRTLADILRSVEGISVSYDRNYSYLGLRGLSRPGDLNSRVLVLVDGHRMNNNVDDQATRAPTFSSTWTSSTTWK
jgi:outer membrane receptor for ferrienterochelin and colicins